jgi:hypothetical protein
MHEHGKQAGQSAGESPIEAQLAAPPPADGILYATLVPDDMPASEHAEDRGSDLIQSRAAVFAILFLVTGALGIPLLWMNQKFNHTERIVWSVVVTIYTVILIAVACAIVMWSYRQIFG